MFAYASNEEAKEVNHPNVSYNVLIDNINGDIVKNGVDDDVDMRDPFIIFCFETNQNSYVELDVEEEDKWQLLTLNLFLSEFLLLPSKFEVLMAD